VTRSRCFIFSWHILFGPPAASASHACMIAAATRLHFVVNYWKYERIVIHKGSVIFNMHASWVAIAVFSSLARSLAQLTREFVTRNPVDWNGMATQSLYSLSMPAFRTQSVCAVFFKSWPELANVCVVYYLFNNNIFDVISFGIERSMEILLGMQPVRHMCQARCIPLLFDYLL
jgi:hypothetical protein